MVVDVVWLKLDSPLGHISGLEPGDAWWRAWNFDPLVVTSLTTLTLLYALGLSNSWRRAGLGRVVSVSRAVAFLLGMQALVIALLSPVDVLSNDLSWVHMVQHSLLTVVAAPLMMFGTPGLVILWAVPPDWRRRWARVLTGRSLPLVLKSMRWLWHPWLIWSLFALGLWLWHLPYLYEYALRDALVHDLEHLTFFVTACLYWRLVLDGRQQRTLPPGQAVLYLFTTSMHAMFLGIFMALSPRPWYGIYDGRTVRWGYSLLEDQQVAGSIMWMPACTTFAIVAVLGLARFISRQETQ